MLASLLFSLSFFLSFLCQYLFVCCCGGGVGGVLGVLFARGWGGGEEKDDNLKG